MRRIAVTYESEPPNVVCTTRLAPNLDPRRACGAGEHHVKDYALALGGSTNTGVQIMSSLSISNYYCITT